MQILKKLLGAASFYPLQGHAAAFGVGASTNNLWLYLLKALASFFFLYHLGFLSIIHQQNSPFLETGSINSVHKEETARRVTNPGPAVSGPLPAIY